jgi:hypothetical protein
MFPSLITCYLHSELHASESLHNELHDTLTSFNMQYYMNLQGIIWVSACVQRVCPSPLLAWLRSQSTVRPFLTLHLCLPCPSAPSLPPSLARNPPPPQSCSSECFLSAAVLHGGVTTACRTQECKALGAFNSTGCPRHVAAAHFPSDCASCRP